MSPDIGHAPDLKKKKKKLILGVTGVLCSGQTAMKSLKRVREARRSGCGSATEIGQQSLKLVSGHEADPVLSRQVAGPSSVLLGSQGSQNTGSPASGCVALRRAKSLFAHCHFPHVEEV